MDKLGYRKGVNVLEVTITPRAQGSVNAILLPEKVIPIGVALHVTTAFTSDGAATLSVGGKLNDGTTDDVDRFITAIALADLTLDSRHSMNGGALTTLQAFYRDSEYITYTVADADFTAGEAKLYVAFVKLE